MSGCPPSATSPSRDVERRPTRFLASREPWRWRRASGSRRSLPTPRRATCSRPRDPSGPTRRRSCSRSSSAIIEYALERGRAQWRSRGRGRSSARSSARPSLAAEQAEMVRRLTCGRRRCRGRRRPCGTGQDVCARGRARGVGGERPSRLRRRAGSTRRARARGRRRHPEHERRGAARGAHTQAVLTLPGRLGVLVIDEAGMLPTRQLAALARTRRRARRQAGARRRPSPAPADRGRRRLPRPSPVAAWLSS